MKITVELTEEEKQELRKRQQEIKAVVLSIWESDIVSQAKAVGYEIPELKAAMDWLRRANDKLQYLTELDVVDNEA